MALSAEGREINNDYRERIQHLIRAVDGLEAVLRDLVQRLPGQIDHPGLLGKLKGVRDETSTAAWEL